jgi:hypothetical protein
MLKRPQLILSFVLVFSAAVLMGNTPVWADPISSMTGISVNNGKIEGSVSGQSLLTSLYYNPETMAYEPMRELDNLWYCPDNPVQADGSISTDGCYLFNYSTLCFGVGFSGTSSGGRYIYWWPR